MGNRGQGRNPTADGRGRENVGRGGGFGGSWRHNALEYVNGKVQMEEEELADTGTSPVKRTNMEIEDQTNPESLTKRRLQWLMAIAMI
jgi:hypothetical protein